MGLQLKARGSVGDARDPAPGLNGPWCAEPSGSRSLHTRAYTRADPVSPARFPVSPQSHPRCPDPRSTHTTPGAPTSCMERCNLSPPRPRDYHGWVESTSYTQGVLARSGLSLFRGDYSRKWFALHLLTCLALAEPLVVAPVRVRVATEGWVCMSAALCPSVRKPSFTATEVVDAGRGRPRYSGGVVQQRRAGQTPAQSRAGGGVAGHRSRPQATLGALRAHPWGGVHPGCL